MSRRNRRRRKLKATANRVRMPKSACILLFWCDRSLPTQVAAEAWENYLKRNRSVVVDLFMGIQP